MADINAASWFTDAFHPSNAAFSTFVVLQVDAEDPLLGISDLLKILDIALFFQYSSDTCFHPGGWDVDLIEAGLLSVPYTSE